MYIRWAKDFMITSKLQMKTCHYWAWNAGRVCGRCKCQYCKCYLRDSSMAGGFRCCHILTCQIICSMLSLWYGQKLVIELFDAIQCGLDERITCSRQIQSLLTRVVMCSVWVMFHQHIHSMRLWQIWVWVSRCESVKLSSSPIFPCIKFLMFIRRGEP